MKDKLNIHHPTKREVAVVALRIIAGCILAGLIMYWLLTRLP